MQEPSKPQSDVRQSRGFVLGSIAFGHGVVHLYDQGFPVLMPTIASAMGLSTLQVSVLMALRNTGFGAVNLGGGLFVDMLKHYWGLTLTGCMAWAGLAFIMVGVSPNLAALALTVALVYIPGALWHLPALAALSQRFPDRRGFAVTVHGFGANAGNIVGPLMAKALLRILSSWRSALFVHAVPALALTLFVWWSLKDVGKGGREARKALGTQVHQAWLVVRNPIVVGLLSAAMLRGLALDAIFNWTPFYLEKELGKGHIEVGLLYGLVTGMGIVSAPALGILSDRFGRKAVLVPGLIVASVLGLLVVSAGDGFRLVLVLAGVGLFSFALHQVMQAAVLDVVGRGTEATAIGLIFGINGIVGIVSPFLSFIIIDRYGGYGPIFYYAGALTLLPAAIIMAMPLRARKTPVAAAS